MLSAGKTVQGLLIAWLAATSSIAFGASDSRELSVTLAPVSDPADATRIGTVDITLRVEGVGAATGEPLLRLPLIVSNVDTVATAIRRIDASDARGPLKLVSRDIALPETGLRDGVSGGPSREWLADRQTYGPITVRYSVPAEATAPPRGPAPPMAFSADSGGASAAGAVFLPLPPSQGRYKTTYAWDLARAPVGSRGISSLGEGTVTAGDLLDRSQIEMSFFMMGRVGTYPAPLNAKGFFGAWQGQPEFDAKALLVWTSDLYQHYLRFFGQQDTQPYSVFLRYNPVNAGGGIGLHNAFVTTFGAGRGSDVARIKMTLAHEMFHTFQPFIARPAGLESSWFGEGLATFYQARLPFRFGMISPDDYLADINWTAARYYTSAMATAPNSEVPKRFWADTRIRTLPYDRGMLYFANVDHAMRVASGNARSLDDLVLDLSRLEKTGKDIENSDWEALLLRNLGPVAVKEFHAFLDGVMPLPASDAFGPCFRRSVVKLRRYELGFPTDILAQPKRIVHDVAAGSAAEQAGLQNGDEIVDPVPQDGILGEQAVHIQLKIRRGDRVFPLSYLPRGELVDAYQWERVPGNKDQSCAL